MFFAYRQSYHELGGDDLPPPPALPDVPEILPSRQAGLGALLARVDRIITEFQDG